MPDKSFLDRIDVTTLVYFVAAAVILVIRQVDSLGFGDFKVQFQKLKQATENAEQATRIAIDASLAGAGRASSRDIVDNLAHVEPGPDPHDPWRGAFGGKAENNGRRLRASVSTLPARADWFVINLVVEAISPGQSPIAGQVVFYLHDTFPNPRRVVAVGPNGRAELSVVSWGAFTAGALCDAGATRLELDLSAQPEFPAEFRSR
jgi:hypothetical protein